MGSGAILAAAVADRAIVRQQLPVRLADDSEPEPDIAVVKFRSDRYRSAHPTAVDVLLIAEVNDATLRYDLEVKVPLYARCGIPEAWIVDLPGARFHLFREPVDGRYRATSTLTEVAVLPHRELSGIAVDLSALV